MEVSNIISATDKVKVPMISSPPSLSAVPCNDPKMTICRHDTTVSQKSDEMIVPMQQQGGPSITSVLKGCNFNNCVINFNSKSTDESQCKSTLPFQAADLLEGINIEELFDD